AVAGVLRQCRLAGRRGGGDGAGRGRGAAARGGAAPVARRGRGKMSRRATGFRLAAVLFGLGVLFLPVVVLIVYLFYASPLVTGWGGFSTRWYAALLEDEKFRTAAWTSLEIAVLAASLALLIGTCAGLAMDRFARFRGRLLFGFMLMAPLVVPEVILGLSLLLLFVAGQSLLGVPAGRRSEERRVGKGGGCGRAESRCREGSKS